MKVIINSPESLLQYLAVAEALHKAWQRLDSYEDGNDDTIRQQEVFQHKINEIDTAIEAFLADKPQS